MARRSAFFGEPAQAVPVKIVFEGAREPPPRIGMDGLIGSAFGAEERNHRTHAARRVGKGGQRLSARLHECDVLRLRFQMDRSRPARWAVPGISRFNAPLPLVWRALALPWMR